MEQLSETLKSLYIKTAKKLKVVTDDNLWQK